MKTSRGWGSPQTPWDGKGPATDSDGWPLGDFGTMVFTDLPNATGTYLLSFTGKATVKAVASNAQLGVMNYDPTRNQTSGSIVVSGTQLALSFTGALQGIQNVVLTRPGCTSSVVFAPALLNALKSFPVIRFMDLTATNNSPVAKWSDRNKVTDAHYTNGKGIPWEYAIDLANLTNKDMWLNIPALADDDYVVQLAAVLKAKLNKDRIVYVEYSNEVWNSQFKQNQQNQAAAEAEVAAAGGKLDLNLDGTDTNKFFWARRRVAKRLLTVSKLFSNAIGKDRVRPVYAAQVADPSHWKVGLEYIKKYYGEPKDFLYGIAGAPYFACGKQWLDLPDLKRDELIGCLAGSVEGQVKNWKREACNLSTWTCTMGQLGFMYNLRTLGYEAGQHVVGTASLALKAEVQRSPEMGVLFKRYYSLWFACGGDLVNQFALVTNYDAPNGFGWWGAYEDLSHESEKSKAIASVIATPLATLKSIPCVAGTPLYPVPSPRPSPSPSPSTSPSPSASPTQLPIPVASP